MEPMYQNILDYIDEIVEHGDQGNVFDWIQKALNDNPDFVSRLRELAKDEKDEDRKDIINTILDDFN